MSARNTQRERRLNPGESIFEASVSHPSLEAQPVSGRLRVRAQGLRFESDILNLELPLDELRIEVVEKPVAGSEFTHPQMPDWVLFAAGRSVLDHHVFVSRNALRLQIKSQRAALDGRRRLRVTAWFLAGFVAVSVLVNGASGWMVRRVAAQVPLRTEQSLGEDMVRELGTVAEFVRAPTVTAQLEALVTRLAQGQQVRDRKFKVLVLKDATPNALGAPGGYLVVTSGLLQLTNDGEEIAGVLAHEMAHVRQRHAFQKLVAAAGPILLIQLLVGDDAGWLGVLAQGSGLRIIQSYSRQTEQEADDLAWEYLVAARIDPRGLGRCLRRMHEAEAPHRALSQQLGGIRPHSLSSHPDPRQRLQRLDRKWAGMKNQTGFVTLPRIAPLPPEAADAQPRLPLLFR